MARRLRVVGGGGASLTPPAVAGSLGGISELLRQASYLTASWASSPADRAAGMLPSLAAWIAAATGFQQLGDARDSLTQIGFELKSRSWSSKFTNNQYDAPTPLHWHPLRSCS